MGLGKRTFALALAVGSMLTMVAIGGPAQAEEAPSGEMGAELTVTVYDGPNGNVVSEQTYDASTADQLLSADTGQVVALGDSGTSGSSSASGCATARVDQWYRWFGMKQWTFRIATYWCWNRADKRVYNVDTWNRIFDVQSGCDWKGIVQGSTGFYAWKDGYPRSGYRHYKMGHFTCDFPDGLSPINFYPENWLKVHSDGTYWWRWDQ